MEGGCILGEFLALNVFFSKALHLCAGDGGIRCFLGVREGGREGGRIVENVCKTRPS